MGSGVLVLKDSINRTPKGLITTSITHQDSEETPQDKDQIKVETIHSVKGASFDAVLLVSTPDSRGKTGYWENWVNNHDETTRFAYVACTRAKYYLLWAVPPLNDVQRRKIQALGLSQMK